MSPILRAFYGALVGAALVLLIHPFSRPYLLSGPWFDRDDKFLSETRMLPENVETLPEPQSLEDAGLWVLTAFERNLTGAKLDTDESLLVIEVVRMASERDVDNAFWHQAEAVLQWHLGNEEAAIEAWETAAIMTRWSDYQNARLDRVLAGLRTPGGRNLAWHYAFVGSEKSSMNSQAIMSFARQLLKGERASLYGLRLATLRNGVLMRDGGRTLHASDMGVETVELAAYSPLDPRFGFPSATGTISPRMLATARDDFLRAVVQNQPEVEEEVKEAFRENDAHHALISPERAEENGRVLLLAAVLCASLPGALLSIGAIGALLAALGWALSASRAAQRLFAPPWTLVAGVLAGLLVYYMTRLFFPALWAAVSLCAFSVRRDDERQAVPKGLGSGYSLAVSTLALAFGLVLALYFVSVSAPGTHVFEANGVSAAPALNTFALISLATMVASLALVTAAVWGFLARVPADRLAGPTFMKFGLQVCLGALALGIALVPVAIGIDRSVGDSLEKIYQNEPTYYLTQ